MIYFQQIGVNGAVAQNEVTKYLRLERELIQNNEEPTSKMELNWFTKMMDKFKGCSEEVMKYKHMNIISDEALLKLEDKQNE